MTEPEITPTDQHEQGTSEKKKKVGSYILGKTLGEGSFAKVRQGVHIIAHEKVAVKVVAKKTLLLKEYVRKNVRREAIVLQKISHPNVVRMYEVMETENSYYLVLEYADCGEFIKYLSIKKSLPESECRKYARQITSAVDHMHASNIVHRDLKLENFLLDRNLDLKIIDFGLSNVFYGDTSLSTQCGSPAYAAPEIFSNQKYGSAVDIWSIGVCLYAMLVGSLPFVPQPANNLAQLQALILKGCEIPEELSEDCRQLLSSMLNVDPRKRAKMEDILRHSWLVHEDEEPILRQPSVAHLLPPVPQASVVNYMTKMLGFKESEVLNALGERKVNSVAATYYLLQKRFEAGLHLVGFPSDMRTARRESAFSAFSIELNNRGPKSASTKDQIQENTENSRASSDYKQHSYKSYLQYLKVSRQRTNTFSKNIFLRRQKTRNSLSRTYKQDTNIPDINNADHRPDFRLTYTPIQKETLFEWDKEGLVRRDQKRIRPRPPDLPSKERIRLSEVQHFPMMVTGDKKRSHTNLSPPPPPNTSHGSRALEPLTPPNSSRGDLQIRQVNLSDISELKNGTFMKAAPGLLAKVSNSVLESKPVPQSEQAESKHSESTSEEDKLEKPELALVLADPCSQEIWGSLQKHKAKLIKGSAVTISRTKTVYANPISSRKLLTPRDQRAVFDEMQKAQIVGRGRLLIDRTEKEINDQLSNLPIKPNGQLYDLSMKPKTAGLTRETYTDLFGSAMSRARSDVGEYEKQSITKLPNVLKPADSEQVERDVPSSEASPSPVAVERLIVEDETPMMRIRITSCFKQ